MSRSLSSAALRCRRMGAMEWVRCCLGTTTGSKLIYAGRTGTGFTQKTHRVLRDQLDELRQKTSPFEKLPAEARRGAIWVRPKLVAQVNFATWTADNLVRQASFKGLREDKPAAEVRREEPTVAPRGGSRRASVAMHPLSGLRRRLRLKKAKTPAKASGDERAGAADSSAEDSR